MPKGFLNKKPAGAGGEAVDKSDLTDDVAGGGGAEAAAVLGMRKMPISIRHLVGA